MKICYLADGQSVHTVRWCRHFISAGNEVHLITLRDASIAGVHVHFIDVGNIATAGGNWKSVLQYRMIKTLVRRINPNILHAHYATSYGLLGALADFHPFVITAMGTDILISPFQSSIYKKMVKYTLKKADWITSMGDHMTEKLILLGVSPEKISNVIFGIDENLFNSKAHKAPVDKFVLTSTRYFEPVYNLPLVFNALKIIKDKIPGLTLNLIGDGSLKSNFESLVKELEIADVVNFMGRVPIRVLQEKLNQSHVYISVAFSDGNSVSLMEAMASGAFIIASDIPANRQWIQEGVNGFIVPVDKAEFLAEKILSVYLNYSKIESACVAYNDKIISEKALWRKNMEQVLEKYKSLTTSKV